VPLDYQPERRGLWIVNRYEGLFLADISAPVVVTIRWHGELWPKYTTLIANDNAPGSVVTEVVGDRCAVVLRV
jgi:hypothetical protein